MAGFFAILTRRDRAAVERLHSQSKTATKQAIEAATKLEATIRGMVDAKREMDLIPNARKDRP